MNTSNYETDGLNFITVSGSFYIFTLPGDIISHHLNDLKYQGVNNHIGGSNSSHSYLTSFQVCASQPKH